MHYAAVKGILSANHGMNLYRGCTHGCIYCDSRSACYHIDHAFEDVLVKENALDLLETALRKMRKKCMIGTGAMADPYMPLEAQIRHTRKALELILRYGFGASLITKSTLVLRDLDLLTEINKKTKCVVQMTLTTYDEALCKKLEPHVSSTKERFEALKVLRDAGIPTIVWLCPILPFINDTMDNIAGLLSYCREAKVHGIMYFGMGMTLREGDREYFYQQLDRLFPGLKEKYANTFGNQYVIASPNGAALHEYFCQTADQYAMIYDQSALFEYLNTLPCREDGEQLHFL